MCGSLLVTVMTFGPFEGAYVVWMQCMADQNMGPLLIFGYGVAVVSFVFKSLINIEWMVFFFWGGGGGYY